jgi:hypothetical protein
MNNKRKMEKKKKWAKDTHVFFKVLAIIYSSIKDKL